MSKIEWLGRNGVTLNPAVGCSKCSPGCQWCYAERFAVRLAKNPLTAKKYAGVVDGRGKWTGKISYSPRWDNRDMPHRVPGKGKFVFVGSMTDFSHPNFDEDRLDAIFASILFDAIVSNGHGHTFIIATKRVGRMLEYFSPGPEAMLRRWGRAGDGWLHVGDGDETFSEYSEGQTIPQPGHATNPNLRHHFLWPLPNFLPLATICNQPEADEKIPLLLHVPAVRRGLSVEPMLGPIRLDRLPWAPSLDDQAYNALTGNGIQSDAYEYPAYTQNGPKLHWVICGGAAGPGVPPMHPDWPHSLRDQCKAAGVPFFFKGWGDWMPDGWVHADTPFDARHATFNGRHELIKSRAGLTSPHNFTMRRVGKARSGRLLGGKLWEEMPI